VPSHGIVVGIGSYPNFGANGTSPNDLPGAVEDARDIAKWLSEAGTEVTLITSEGYNGANWTVGQIHPVKSDISTAYRPFATSAAPRIGDRLTVYMAGHGLAPDPRSRALILADAVASIPAYVPHLEAPLLIDWFANQTHFDELVLWMDVCGTRSVDYKREGIDGLANIITRAGSAARIFIAFGSGNGRASYEGPVDPQGRVRGLFTDRLLRGLSGSAAGLGGEVRSASLANYLRNGAPTATDGTEPRVNPVQVPVVPLEDDMLFATAGVPSYRIQVGAGGTVLPDGTTVTLTSPPGPLSATAVVAGGWVSFRLGVGLYKLTAPGLTRFIEIGASTPTDIV
jgi:hypothetical protein